MALMKKFKTNVNIDNDKAPNDDLDFIRKHGFKPTNLLRAKIKELRAIEEGAPDTKELIRQREAFRNHRDKLIDFINKHGLTDAMIAEL